MFDRSLDRPFRTLNSQRGSFSDRAHKSVFRFPFGFVLFSQRSRKLRTVLPFAAYKTYLGVPIKKKK